MVPRIPETSNSSLCSHVFAFFDLDGHKNKNLKFLEKKHKKQLTYIFLHLSGYLPIVLYKTSYKMSLVHKGEKKLFKSQINVSQVLLMYLHTGRNDHSHRVARIL